MSNDIGELIVPLTTVIAATTATAHYMDWLNPIAATVATVWILIQIINFFWKLWVKRSG